jgi:hypothetical protein
VHTQPGPEAALAAAGATRGETKVVAARVLGAERLAAGAPGRFLGGSYEFFRPRARRTGPGSVSAITLPVSGAIMGA